MLTAIHEELVIVSLFLRVGFVGCGFDPFNKVVSICCTWRPEEGEGMEEEWEGGGGVSGRQGTVGVPPSRR